MRVRYGICAVVGCAVMMAAGAARGAEAEMEKRVLAGAESAKEWSAAECTVTPAQAPAGMSGSALHWHVTVDHFAGEAKYPIGWPRINYSFKTGQRDWTGWDFLRMRVYTETSREKLPREAAGLELYVPVRAGEYSRGLGELAKGKWAEIRIPLSEVPRHGDVRVIQLHISESNYRHKDEVDFYIDEVALLRYARPTLLGFEVENSVMFSDARQIPVRFTLTGVKSDEAVEVGCELVKEGKVVARTQGAVKRGGQRMLMELAGAKIGAGEYEVRAKVAGGGEASARVRVVESPWTEAE